MSQIDILYTVHDQSTGLTRAEHGLASIGRQKDIVWLATTLSALSDLELLQRFKPWPGLEGLEGWWGTITLKPYVVLCQLDAPPPHEWELGGRAVLKVDLVADAEVVLAHLRELSGE